VLLPEVGLEEATQLAERLREGLKESLLGGLEPRPPAPGVRRRPSAILRLIRAPSPLLF